MAAQTSDSNGAQSAAGPESMKKHTRFHVTSKNQQPPALEAVLKRLSKEGRRIGAFKQPDEVRGIFAGAHRDYAVRGTADDLLRFLQNYSVLVRDGEEGEIYFDAERGMLLVEACLAGVAPPPVKDPAAQLTRLKEQIVARRERPSSPGGDSGEIRLPATLPDSLAEDCQQFKEMIVTESDEELRRSLATFEADRAAARRKLLEVDLHCTLIEDELGRRAEMRRLEERRLSLAKEVQRRRDELAGLESSRTAKADELAKFEAELARLSVVG